ncbi:D-alanyl-D-alanine carboxypeptidase/D-alanyl-D-alanine-endopeptidase [Lipingzhangella sp. LS1_29]|uniref:D-alanyl-D-alanine carboxypeptidase/D-alanyl-D-alanine-endopeptidase n=1 Tax=Lipingzhangella rawalii TaxID=2055835 RepID=A0ABU2H3J5_9ACTN|nr:D-alanyl-D-alanine carboxypeptidase/D-alanyl-D-alanine-endopeptidase [Lipingzhangella rawalii]MDS1269868.1 D-alanyl-D-alanine carboxypeptidase/D-alanyl-D-alanine-endopeptidase [Lipingzhangella rawalii]
MTPPGRTTTLSRLSRTLRRGAVILGCAAGLVSLTAPVSLADTAGPDPPGVAELRSDLEDILDDPALTGATSGLMVHSRTEGDTLYAQDADTALVPASNAKLFTGAAALDVLGPEYRFRTSVVAEREPDDDGVLDTDLHLVGTGDPTVTPAAYADLAEDVADAGVHTVTGDLVADDTWFDDERLAPDWEAGDEPFAYAAQISALTVATDDDRNDTGVTEVRVTPGASPGAPVEVDVGVASGYVEVENIARTGAPGRESSLEVTRAHGTNTIEVRGMLPVDAGPVTRLRTVDEPTDLAAHVLAEALDDAGVQIEGETGRASAPPAAVELAQRDSAPLGELMIPLMKFSNNAHAEILVKTLGRIGTGVGSWEAGLDQLHASIRSLDVDTQALDLTDGSGLSRSNELTAEVLIDLFAGVPHQEWYEIWFESLPVAGEEDPLVGGTLRNRMVDTVAAGTVHAKTGTLTGVSALSGYVTGAEGEELVFSVLNNGHAGPAPTHVQDAIAVRLAEFDREATAAAPARAPGTRSQQHPVAPGSGMVECSWDRSC